jgi:V8-like Glu-specific endopeptidase
MCNGGDCYAIAHDGKRAKLNAPIRVGGYRGNAGREEAAKDWAIYQVNFGDRPDFTARQVSSRQYGKPVQVARAGFGALRVLSNDDIRDIKRLQVEYRRKNPRASTNLNSAGFAKYLQGKGYNIFNDSNRLKAVKNCNAVFSKGILEHSCDSWGGDSGSGLYARSGGNWYLVGLNSAGTHDLRATRYASWGPNISNFIRYLRPPAVANTNNGSNANPGANTAAIQALRNRLGK